MANTVGPHGHWNEKKVWTMFLTSFRRLTTAIFPLSFMINFLLLGIDRFYMDSFEADSIRVRLPTGPYILETLEFIFKKEGDFWCRLVETTVFYLIHPRCGWKVTFFLSRNSVNVRLSTENETERGNCRVTSSFLLFIKTLLESIEWINMRWRNSKGCWQYQNNPSTQLQREVAFVVEVEGSNIISNINICFSNMFCCSKEIWWHFSPLNWSKYKFHPYSLRGFSLCPSLDSAPSSLSTRKSLDTLWSAVLSLAHQHQKDLIALSAGCLWPPCSAFISHTPSVLLINH